MISILNIDIRRVAVAFVAIAALTACSGSDMQEPDGPGMPPAEGSEYTMQFAAVASYDLTASRAGETALETVYHTFGVYAWKKNSADALEDVLRHADGTPYETRYAHPKWSYIITSGSYEQYERFWDFSAKEYTFMAYAPYQDPAKPATDPDYHNITVDRTGVHISDIDGNKPAGTITQWLEAHYKRINASDVADYDLLGPTPATPYLTGLQLSSIVKLRFHHIMSALEFKAYSADGSEIKLKKMKITVADGIYTHADYTGQHTWANYSSPETTLYDNPDIFDLIIGLDADHPVSIAEVIEVPQSLTDKSITIEITTTDNKTVRGTFPFVDPWESDKRYIYTLKVSVVNEYILLESSIDEWGEPEEVEIEGELDNW